MCLSVFFQFFAFCCFIFADVAEQDLFFGMANQSVIFQATQVVGFESALLALVFEFSPVPIPAMSFLMTG